MDECWREIKEFPKYSVSDWGNVRREPSGRPLSLYTNQYGVLCVGLMRGHTQFNRSVPLLVARAFISQPPRFDTPINLNGDRLDNHVDNLMWRTRQFAIRYNRQFRYPYPNPIHYPIRDIATDEEYPNSFVVATTFGLLEEDVVLSIMNHTYTWPTYQLFEVA